MLSKPERRKTIQFILSHWEINGILEKDDVEKARDELWSMTDKELREEKAEVVNDIAFEARMNRMMRRSPIISPASAFWRRGLA